MTVSATTGTVSFKQSWLMNNFYLHKKRKYIFSHVYEKTILYFIMQCLEIWLYKHIYRVRYKATLAGWRWPGLGLCCGSEQKKKDPDPRSLLSRSWKRILLRPKNLLTDKNMYLFKRKNREVTHLIKLTQTLRE